MKKVLSLILISLMLITMATNVFASDLVVGEDEVISGDAYNSAQKDETKNNATTNNTNNKVNTNNSALPQTGIEDSGMGILLIVCVACAIFAYKKVSDYRNI